MLGLTTAFSRKSDENLWIDMRPLKYELTPVHNLGK